MCERSIRDGVFLPLYFCYFEVYFTISCDGSSICCCWFLCWYDSNMFSIIHIYLTKMLKCAHVNKSLNEQNERKPSMTGICGFVMDKLSIVTLISYIKVSCLPAGICLYFKLQTLPSLSKLRLVPKEIPLQKPWIFAFCSIGQLRAWHNYS